eukprot:scaffold653820_cov62-Prasinocladus_malaysianus.AAC.1
MQELITRPCACRAVRRSHQHSEAHSFQGGPETDRRNRPQKRGHCIGGGPGLDGRCLCGHAAQPAVEFPPPMDP